MQSPHPDRPPGGQSPRRDLTDFRPALCRARPVVLILALSTVMVRNHAARAAGWVRGTSHEMKCRETLWGSKRPSVKVVPYLAALPGRAAAPRLRPGSEGVFVAESVAGGAVMHGHACD